MRTFQELGVALGFFLVWGDDFGVVVEREEPLRQDLCHRTRGGVTVPCGVCIRGRGRVHGTKLKESTTDASGGSGGGRRAVARDPGDDGH